ncbi:flagellin [Methanohalobium evestigatum Z-7303]|uniref:Flagellin n=1 Tax=Methanohalobium evestigatum (strain ATCC BAA-1072 / DSM 3721 / NBRC 107634 / OCM 161 / Z-7303) TaxID=644295 RepID=D7E701_METEZ|nr:archaellin/type IV pilin N-terminal domain-containing protein [Methanohalobium evestigatum]ADI73625.1 flagellin [Methanohalobium evestigatum Z-7303]
MEKLKNLFMKDEQGQVGIGTLIIFIAMVLVAAVAAAVLIQTSGNLQQRAQSTGQEATAEVSSNMDIKAIEGIRANNTSGLSNTIDYLKIRTGVSAGATAMDLSQLIITISDSDERNVLEHNESGLNGSNTMNYSKEHFSLNSIRDEDNSFSKTNPVMNRGDLVTLNVSTLTETTAKASYMVNGMSVPNNPVDSELKLDTRTSVSITLTPESGTSKQIDFMTPPSYGVDKRISLYP